MMHRKMGWTLGLALVFVAGLAVADGGHRNVFFSDDGERFDLSDLIDGETRYFGSRDHEIKATREGDMVTLTFGEDERTHTLTCSVAAGDCTVITSGDDGRVVVLKSGGDLHSEHELTVITGATEGNRVLFAPEDGTAHVTVHGGGPLQWIDADGGEGRAIVEVKAFSGNVLRCPEGDTTMRLGADEPDEGPYYCPKHNLELKKMERHDHRIHQDIRILLKDDDE